VKKAVQAAKERCGIDHFSKRLLRNLSGGYQQRVGIAQAIVHGPKVVIFDEPTNGLDPIQTVEIRHLLREIAVDRAVILSTHILPEVQLSCDDIVMINQGKLVFSGTIDRFDNYIAPNSLIAVFNAAPAVETLEAIQAVEAVDKLTEKRFRLFFSDPDGIVERVVRSSVDGDWNIQEIALEKGSLDEVFAQLSGKTMKP
jgi:ABC-2 type transport system ATP-binding protein